MHRSTKFALASICISSLFATSGCHKLYELANEGHQRGVHYDEDGNELPAFGPRSHSHLQFEDRMRTNERGSQQPSLSFEKDQEEGVEVQHGTPIG